MLTLSLLSLLSGDAHALSCMWGVYDANVRDAADVPINAELVVMHTFAGSDDLDLELLAADDTTVPATLEVAFDHAVLVPDEPLQAHSSYRVVTTEESDSWALAAFSTSDELDDTAPAAPVITRAKKQKKNGVWGSTAGISVEVDPVEGASHYEIEVGRDEDFSDAWRVVSMWPSAFVGDGLCLDNMPDYEPGGTWFVRARAVDLAGNASAWTTAEQANRGCSTAGGAASGIWVLGLLALFRRRR